MTALVQGFFVHLVAMAPTWTELTPWTDRKNRFHPLRASVFALLLLPGMWLLVRWLLHGLGAEPLKAAIHGTGYWTVWLLLASLAITPLKALASSPNVAVVRRMVGNAALIYALIHLSLYCADENWQALTIIGEIVKRFYLTIGFVALMGLIVLGATSSDGWVRSMGSTWKRLHRLVYGIMALSLIHYVLQSKLDVSQVLLAAGVFSWLMMWRALPIGRDRDWPILLLLSAAAATLTLAVEFAWYRFGTHVDPVRVIRGEFDIGYGLHPAGQVLLLGLAVTASALLRQLALRFGSTLLFTVAVYGLGALLFDAAMLFLSVDLDDAFPDGPSPWVLDIGWIAAFAVLGAMRWRVRDMAQARLFDALWIAAIGAQVALPGLSTRGVGAGVAVLIAGAVLMFARRVWVASRGTALLLPVLILLAAASAGLL